MNTFHAGRPDAADLLDLTAEMGADTLAYPGSERAMCVERLDAGIARATISRFGRLDVHCGTHLDAPRHFAPEGVDVAGLGLGMPQIVVLQAPEGPIPASVLDGHAGSVQGKAVLFSTGWERHAGTRKFFEEYPPLSEDLARRLVEHAVNLVGVDTPSVDPVHGDFPVHRILLEAGIPILEGLVEVAELARRLAAGHTARLIAFPLRVLGLEGSPVRAVAWFDPPRS